MTTKQVPHPLTGKKTYVSFRLEGHYIDARGTEFAVWSTDRPGFERVYLFRKVAKGKPSRPHWAFVCKYPDQRACAVAAP